MSTATTPPAAPAPQPRTRPSAREFVPPPRPWGRPSLAVRRCPTFWTICWSEGTLEWTRQRELVRLMTQGGALFGALSELWREAEAMPRVRRDMTLCRGGSVGCWTYCPVPVAEKLLELLLPHFGPEIKAKRRRTDRVSAKVIA